MRAGRPAGVGTNKIMRLFTEKDLVSKLEEGFKLAPLQPAAEGAAPPVGLA